VIGNTTKQIIREAGWILPDYVWNCLSEYERSFFQGELQRSLDYYIRRLKALGFQKMQRVLDAGCGIGQWAIALSSLNKHIDGVDINIERLLISNILANSLEKTTCAFRYSFLESLPFEPETFDGIFCYGVFMFTHMPKTLSEFFRVLKPGGNVYLNANCSGWYAHLLLDRGLKTRNFSMMGTALYMIARTMVGRKKNIVVRKKWLENLVKVSGFQVVAIGLEGEINIDKNIETPEPIYNRYFYGLPGIIEVLAQKACV
jgi:ubiquinone/menaquinone biosynthesis C-methylase UbiE